MVDPEASSVNLESIPVSDETIRSWCAPALAQFGTPNDAWPRTATAATEIVARVMSREWIRKALSARSKSYLKLPDDVSDSARYAIRVYDLAEMLVNLQHAPGFGARIEELRTRTIEDSVTELEGARAFHRLGWDCKFVKASGSKKSDYDLHVTHPDGTTLAVEAKCKVEDTPFTSETVRYTLEKARRQLPKNMAGVIFMRLSRHWIEQGNLAAIEQAIETWLRNTTRVNLVYCHWDEFTPARDPRARLTRFRCFENASSRHVIPALRALAQTPANPRWRSLGAIVPELDGVVGVASPRTDVGKSLHSEKSSDLDLREGFSCHSVVCVASDARQQRKLLFEYLDRRTRESISIGIDETGTVRAWLRDRVGRQHVTKSVTSIPFDSWHLLSWYFGMEDAHRFSIEVEVNHRSVAREHLDVELTPCADFHFSIGSNAEGSESAVFGLSECLLSRGKITEAQKDANWIRVAHKFGLTR